MTPLEIALIILIIIWSIILIIVAAAVIMILLAVKKAIGKANDFLDKTELVANKADVPSKVVIASILAFMAKNSFGPLKKFISILLSSRK